MPTWLCLMLGLVIATPDPNPEPAAPVAAVETGLETLVLQVDGLSYADLDAALRLRAPKLLVHSSDDPDFTPPSNELFAYAIAHRKADVTDTWAITLILSDGRAFFRSVTADDDTAPRVLSTTLINLIVAAETGSIEPDATREVPVRPDADATTPTERVAPRSPPPTTDIGLGLQGAVVAGFGPPTDTDILVGGAGGLELALRVPLGVMVALDVRPTSRTRLGHRIVRVRTSIGAGYALRRGSFELAALGFFSVEPWFLLADGQSETVAPGEFSRVLLGGGARVSPGYRVGLGPRHSLHIGLRLDVGGSGMPRGGIGRITSQRGDGSLQPLFRLGGLELAAGLELLLWFGTTGAPT